MNTISPKSTLEIRSCDFQRFMRLSPPLEECIKMIHSHFAHLISEDFSSLLKKTTRVTLQEVEYLSLGRYSRYLTKSSSPSLIRANLLDGRIIFDLEASLIHLLIGGLLGDTYHPPSISHSLNSLEIALKRRCTNLILSKLAASWRAVFPISFTIETLTMNLEDFHLMPQDSFFLISHFQVEIEEIKYQFSLAVLAQDFRGLQILEAMEEKKDDDFLPIPYEEVSVPVKVLLGSCQVTQDEMNSLQPGDILLLNNSTHDPFKILFGENLQLSAKGGCVGKKRGITLIIPKSVKKYNYKEIPNARTNPRRT